LPTIEALREKGAKVILASHIETEGVDEPTLKPVHEYLSNVFPVAFVVDYYPNRIDAELEAMQEGGVLLLENLRRYSAEKSNDEKFASHLASFADLYVNDSFAVDHREHASVVGIPKHIPGYAGLLVEKEVRSLSHAFNPEHPFVFIIGGAKFETKLPLIEKFLEIADTAFVTGALANDVLKARGFEVGQALLSKGVDVSDIMNHSRLKLPVDVVVKYPDGKKTKDIEDVSATDAIVDAGPRTVDLIELATARSAFSRKATARAPRGSHESLRRAARAPSSAVATRFR
jgi:phosphoglycerate kinase